MAARPLSPSSPWREGRLAQVNAHYAAYLAAGFPTAEFDAQPEPETLQCRDELDRTNWLGLLMKCQAKIAMGRGEEPCDPPIRCTSNRMYAVSHEEAQARMYGLLDQVGQAQANWWRLKDAVRDCPSREALSLIDLEEGWP